MNEDILFVESWPSAGVPARMELNSLAEVILSGIGVVVDELKKTESAFF
jgi:hypothetical protein